jgi:hypothetical protein
MQDNKASSLVNAPQQTCTTATPPELGFIKLRRSPASDELLRDPKAFALLALVALRARWRTTLSVDRLELCEALLGDHKTLRLTRGEYRAALGRLETYGLITTRTTNKGTIAKLSSSLVFDINACKLHQSNNQQKSRSITKEQPENDLRITDEQPLTKKARMKHGKNGRRPATILDIKDQMNMIEQRIEHVRSDRANWEYGSDHCKHLKAEALTELRTLKAKKAELTLIGANL